ncbi:MAG TPA: hypothetical protein VD931_07715 [Baekduia sp.]|nr:hypothetical protein [Baekduia sp.]
MRTAVIGLRDVGLPLAVALASARDDVVGATPGVDLRGAARGVDPATVTPR